MCTGSLGDPIVNITFGSGSNPGAALQAATTGYNFTANDCPPDGSYTVRNNTTACNGNTWHTLNADHTGNANGYFMLINASNSPSDFYVDTVRNLCPNSTYEFAAWIINVLNASGCGGNGNRPFITFTIEKTDGTLIYSFNTGNIQISATPMWIQYKDFFTTPLGVTDVVLRMRNNAPGGCGNDLALDDITFRRCGPLIAPNIIGLNTTIANFCQGISQTYNITALLSAGFVNPVYQWQLSLNGNAFMDIAGANSLSYAVNFLPTNTVGLYKYRLAVSELGTQSILNCRLVSDPITITINPSPIIIIDGKLNLCQGENILLTATGADAYTWIGPNSFTNNTNTVQISNINIINAGTYTATGTNSAGCQVSLSKIVVINPKPLATVTFLDTSICVNSNVRLIASGGSGYNWFPVINISSTVVNNPVVNPKDSIKYFVEVTNLLGCKDTASVNINVIKLPIVNAGADQVLIGNSIVQLAGSITGSYTNYFWTSITTLNNSNTLNPTAQIVENTKFYLTATAIKNCGLVTDSIFVKLFSAIYIPNVFTPNGDNINDTWRMPSLNAFPNFELKVYNRYGQIIFEQKNNTPDWNGRFKGERLPTGTYVYIIDLKNSTPLLKGAVLLLR